MHIVAQNQSSFLLFPFVSLFTLLCIVQGKKYFFKNSFEKFQTDFSNFETPSLAVSKFRNAQKKKCFQKIPKRLEKNVFKFCKRFFSFSKFKTILTSFPAVFNMKTNKFSFSPKFRFQNLIVFKCFKTIFSVLQPFSV